jgi:hypothetical protein
MSPSERLEKGQRWRAAVRSRDGGDYKVGGETRWARLELDTMIASDSSREVSWIYSSNGSGY